MVLYFHTVIEEGDKVLVFFNIGSIMLSSSFSSSESPTSDSMFITVTSNPSNSFFFFPPLPLPSKNKVFRWVFSFSKFR